MYPTFCNGFNYLFFSELWLLLNMTYDIDTIIYIYIMEKSYKAIEAYDLFADIALDLVDILAFMNETCGWRKYFFYAA